MSTYLAADFGGGSGRIMAGTLTEGKLKLCLLGFSFSF